MPLDVLVEIHPEEDPQDREQVDFEEKAEGDFEQDQVDGQGRVETRRDRFGKNGLNRFGWRKHSENFT